MTNESLLELWDLVYSRDFVSLGLLMALVVLVGSGLAGLIVKRAARVRSALERPWVRGLCWSVVLVVVGATFYFGVMPHGERGSEWGEVLFNGQLL